jgi:hypothetical protein
MSGTDASPGRLIAIPWSRGAAFGTLASVALALAGIGGEIGNPGSVLFPMIAAIGFSALAIIVLTY